MASATRGAGVGLALVKEYLRAVGINSSILSLDTTAADTSTAAVLALAASAGKQVEAQVTEDNGFAGLGLDDKLVAALARTGITTPFPIQAATIPDALAGKDLLGRGQTGSGKTMAFGLPMLHRLAGRPRVAVISVGRNRYGHPAPEALERIGRSGAELWRTDEEGDITVTTDGTSMTIRGRRGPVVYPVQ